MVNVFRNPDGSLNASKTTIENPLDEGSPIAFEAKRLAKKFNSQIDIPSKRAETGNFVNKIVTEVG